MKTIQEASREFIDRIHPNQANFEYISSTGKINGSLHSDLLQFGRDMVKFAQRWISVEEELPTSEKKVLCKNTFDGKDTYTVATYHVKHKMWIAPIHMCDPNIEYTPEFWRPINLE